MRSLGILAGALLVLTLLTGCAERANLARDVVADTGSSTAGSSAAGSPPAGGNRSACDEVWREGGTLPRNYHGCLEGGVVVRAQSRYCEFGRPLLVHEDRFYAVRGGRIAQAEPSLRQDPAYQRVLATCSG